MRPARPSAAAGAPSASAALRQKSAAPTDRSPCSRAGRLAILALTGLAGAAAAGCVSRLQEDRIVLENARTEYHAGRHREAAAALGPACDPRSRPLAGEALYMRGVCRCAAARTAGGKGVSDGMFDEARADLEAALAVAREQRDDELARMSQAALGHTWFFRRRPDFLRAAGAYRSALPPDPDTPTNVDIEETTFYLAVSEERLGDWASAGRRHRALLRDHPQGRYADKCRSHLAAGAFSVQTGTFRQSANAADQQGKLLRAGLPAIVERRSTGAPGPAGDQLVVKVGRYRTYDEALAVLPRVQGVLAAAGDRPEAIVVP